MAGYTSATSAVLPGQRLSPPVPGAAPEAANLRRAQRDVENNAENRHPLQSLGRKAGRQCAAWGHSEQHRRRCSPHLSAHSALKASLASSSAPDSSASAELLPVQRSARWRCRWSRRYAAASGPLRARQGIGGGDRAQCVSRKPAASVDFACCRAGAGDWPSRQREERPRAQGSARAAELKTARLGTAGGARLTGGRQRCPAGWRRARRSSGE